MDSFFFTLSASCLCGLAWVAYSNPRGYSRLFLWLMALLGAAVIATTALYAGTQIGTAVMQGHFTTIDKAEAALVAAKLGESPLTVGAALAASVVYLIILRALPTIMGNDPSTKQ